ncbi:SRPBCC domain-containing protein [Paenibacillus dauci]|uniref:SRPBCC domain-containing protein n=1 Tax=Paenibacillus dauci TaxID=1567106 RepID=UPI000619A2F3|nr:SRPBCC domain-containing protein [Paenibacillus dauci]
MSNQMVSRVEGQSLVLEREFNAPKELVFRAFAEAEHLKHWWGPRGWTLTVCNIDFRPGGVWHYCMKCVDESQGDFYGYESWGKAVYGEIAEPDQFVYTDYFSDAEGKESEEMPSSRITMLFEEHNGSTKLISRASYDSAEALRTVLDMGMEQGIAETWDRLDEYVQTLHQ